MMRLRDPSEGSYRASDRRSDFGAGHSGCAGMSRALARHTASSARGGYDPETAPLPTPPKSSCQKKPTHRCNNIHDRTARIRRVLTPLLRPDLAASVCGAHGKTASRVGAAHLRDLNTPIGICGVHVPELTAECGCRLVELGIVSKNMGRALVSAPHTSAPRC